MTDDKKDEPETEFLTELLGMKVGDVGYFYSFRSKQPINEILKLSNSLKAFIDNNQGLFKNNPSLLSRSFNNLPITHWLPVMKALEAFASFFYIGIDAWTNIAFKTFSFMDIFRFASLCEDRIAPQVHCSPSNINHVFSFTKEERKTLMDFKKFMGKKGAYGNNDFLQIIVKIHHVNENYFVETYPLSNRSESGVYLFFKEKLEENTRYCFDKL